MDRTRRLFRKCGFYLHAGWVYEHPFAVRRWTRRDYAGMFRLLRRLNLDHVMIWPMVELAPPPLSDADAVYFMEFREVIEDARGAGLDCLLTFSPNLSTCEDVRAQPDIRDRVWFPHERVFRFDRGDELNAYLRHTGLLLACLDNADGYVFIDGDPGGYPGAKPTEFLAMLDGIRRGLERAAPGRRPEIVHWAWCGWGADWEKDGIWKSNLKALVGGMLAELAKNPPAEPWGLMPGRHRTEDRGNGRMVIQLADEAGLMPRSTLMLYEIIEQEPSPPAFIVHFEDIRRVLRQEMKYGPVARGVMGNAQQPVVVLQNLFYFARCVGDPSWLDRTDEEVLNEFARFLGGDADALVPAWKALDAGTETLPDDAAERVRRGRLVSDAAADIPGGPELYLDLLADFLQTCMDVRHTSAAPTRSAVEAASRLQDGLLAFVRWWSRHRYVFTGAQGNDFRASFTHPRLRGPLSDWTQEALRFLGDRILQRDIAASLAERGPMPPAVAEEVVADWCRPKA